MKDHVSRRRFLKNAGTSAAITAFPAISRAQALTKIRVGYLHVLSVDAQMLLGNHLGTWQKEGLELEAREFTTGIELFQALVGGSLDVLTTGGVLANFPARGQGKVFLFNDLEFATGQIWVNPDQGSNRGRPQGQKDCHDPRNDSSQSAAPSHEGRRDRLQQGRGDR